MRTLPRYWRLVGASMLPAGVVGGLIVAAVIRQGGFYPVDAVGLASVSMVMTTSSLAAGCDRRAIAVVATVGPLALWWLVRAIADGNVESFLPLGASMIGFVSAFLVVRRLLDPQRIFAAKLVAALGAGEGALGLFATIARWSPLSGGGRYIGDQWRLASTLTYANAAGMLLVLSFLMALSLDQRARSTRLMICVCTAALVATQSRGAVLGLMVGLLLIPFSQLRTAAMSTILGLVGGLTVVATSSGGKPQPVAGVMVVLVVIASFAIPRQLHTSSLTRRTRIAMAIGIFGASAAIGVVGATTLRVPIERRSALADIEARGYLWRTAFDQWRSSPLIGVGPDQPLTLHSPYGTVATFVHNEYLQILAYGGLIAGILVLAAMGCVVAAVRRDDVTTSCAVAGLCAFALIGAVDFDWHLPALGLLGGWVAGLAGKPRTGLSPVSTSTADSKLDSEFARCMDCYQAVESSEFLLVRRTSPRVHFGSSSAI
jgi:O-Antigen ligase